MMTKVIVSTVVMMMMMISDHAGDTNPVFDPCLDTKVKRFDGFTFRIAFSIKESFFFNQTQLSPCEKRLPLIGSVAKVALFRPKVDEISLLTISGTNFSPLLQTMKSKSNVGTRARNFQSLSGGHMVAFAGRQFAARSPPVFVADFTHTVNSFTLVLEFQKGTLQNMFWKKYGCAACSGDSVVCLNNTDCAVPSSKCKSNGGTVDCNIGVQLAFSGTDKNNNVLNTWYEVAKLRQYSLYALYSDIRDVFTS